ncbi:MAG: hypothetical protein IJX50_05305 [Clostridia bacterium]|nr:hypothetical protein [Clostridia bacterium]
MRDFIRYYKWHLIFFLIIAVCTAYVVVKVTEDKTPDLVVGYFGTHYVNDQTFNDNLPMWKELLHDSNEDGEKKAAMYAFIYDRQRDIDEDFVDVVDSDQYDLYISTKETFENFEDKTRFEDVETYLNTQEEKVPMLKDSKGRIYAISIEDNDYANYMGLNDSKDIYIAVAAPKKGDELTTNKKNARNIAQYIIEEG